MSKSLGNVIHPKDVVDKYGVDAFRYYFLRHIPSYEDGDFNWDRMEAAYNNELANELGNAVQRTAVMIQKYQNGIIKVQHSSSSLPCFQNLFFFFQTQFSFLNYSKYI